jgi:hypothetical protein
MSGCVVFSFYPIYTPDDLFANKLLLGEFISRDDSTSWNFEFINTTKNDITTSDSLGYQLKIDENDKEIINSTMEVHLIKIKNQLVADFYLTDYHKDEIKYEVGMFDLHMIPVHTFAKVKLYGNDSIQFNWMNPEWMKKQIKNEKLQLHLENNGQTTLLTATPLELQGFMSKYIDTEEAFEDGLEQMLYKMR